MEAPPPPRRPLTGRGPPPPASPNRGDKGGQDSARELCRPSGPSAASPPPLRHVQPRRTALCPPHSPGLPGPPGRAAAAILDPPPPAARPPPARTRALRKRGFARRPGRCAESLCPSAAGPARAPSAATAPRPPARTRTERRRNSTGDYPRRGPVGGRRCGGMKSGEIVPRLRPLRSGGIRGTARLRGWVSGGPGLVVHV